MGCTPLVQQVEELLKLVLHVQGTLGGGGRLRGGGLRSGGGGGGSGRAGTGARRQDGHGLRLGPPVQAGLQVVVVPGSRLHVAALRLADALLVVEVHHPIALLQDAGRLRGVAGDAVGGDRVVGALKQKGEEW